MAKFKSQDEKNYVGVNDRIAEFREKHPQGSITTFRTTDERGVVFKAVVVRTKEEAETFAATSLAAATGHAYLPDEESGEKMEEYAETVSVGRALANLGLKVTESVASKEEMDQYKRKTGQSVEDAEEDDEKEDKRKPKDDKDSDDDADDSDDDSDEDDEDEDGESAEEPKLKSSRRFSGKRSSSRFS